MVLFTRGQAYQQIQKHRKRLRTWMNLFDSRMSVEQFIQHEHNSTDSKYRCPAWDASYRCNFRKDNRLFFAMNFWRTFPESLREDVDQFEGLFPDLRYDYGGLEDQYFFVHRLACEHLVDVAEAEGFGGVAISAAGDNCRLIIKSLQDRRRLWGDIYTIGDWPDCHPNRLELPADIRQSLSAGQATLDILRSLLGRWRSPKAGPESPATVPDSTKPIWDSESSQVHENALTVPAMPTKYSGSKPTLAGSLQLRLCERKAWNQYQQAMDNNSELITDKEVYNWFVDKLADESDKLPSFDTWAKYIRNARAAAGQPKNRRGVAHETRSVVSAKRL